MSSFYLKIQTPEKEVFSGKVNYLVADAKDGKVEILPNHASFATILKSGKIRYQLEAGEEVTKDSAEGFLTVNKNLATVLLKK
jgi:F-type H+-transporting ATPase subunit epsilon